jgi:uncharacterized protein YdaU (DUF1376 family)
MSVGLAMMPWFPGDFMRSTRGWSITAKGVYRELLDAQWDMGDLPANPDELRETIGATPDEWEIGWKKCESKFPVRRGGRRNWRLEAHRVKSEQIANLRSEIGKKGGQASGEARAKQKSSKGSTFAEPKVQANHQPIAQPKVNHPVQSSPIHSESSPDHTGSLNGNGEDSRAAQQPSGDPEFDILKMIYPKRGGSQRWPDARKAINARRSEGHTWQQIHDGARRYASFIRATGKERTEHVQQAATFVGTNKSFLESWDLPASKADARLAGNVTAAQEFMRRTEPKH